MNPPPTDFNGAGNSSSRITFNLQTYLTEMEARLTSRINEVKTYCPNDRRIGRVEGVLKWLVAASVAVAGALTSALVAHLLARPH